MNIAEEANGHALLNLYNINNNLNSTAKLIAMERVYLDDIMLLHSKQETKMHSCRIMMIQSIG